MTAPASTATRPAHLVGSHGFRAVLSMCMAATALGVDAMLPAFPEIRDALGLAPGATEVTGLISFFLLGNSLGLLPAGLLADRFGRRVVMWGGFALYAAGVVGTIVAPTLAWMFVARFVWGLGASGPRVSALAMVRDAYSGEQMARQMSFIMAVFLLVPAVAPTLAAGVLWLGPWEWVPVMCGSIAVAVALAVIRLPETWPPEARRPLALREVWASCRIVITTPGTVGALVSLTALFGVFISYLASSEVVLDQVFGLERWFPAFFGGLSLVMLAAMLLNGRLVQRASLERVMAIIFAASMGTVAVLLVVALAWSGRPPFVVYVVVLGAVLFTQQMLIPNLNAAAMRPLAAVAGTAAAILGMVSGAVGSVIGGFIDRRFDGTITPLAIAFVVCNAIALVAWRQSVAAMRRA